MAISREFGLFLFSGTISWPYSISFLDLFVEEQLVVNAIDIINIPIMDFIETDLLNERYEVYGNTPGIFI